MLSRYRARAGSRHVAHADGGSNQAGGFLMGLASGTSMNPQSWPMPMLMLNQSNWSLMFMGQAFVVDTQESGPRGHDKFYSPNWGMFAASHNLGGGSFMIQTMLRSGSCHYHRSPLSRAFSTGETPLTESHWWMPSTRTIS